jgi:glucan-binding YG repeat protein
VVVGTWTEANGQWQFTDSSGQRYRDNWAAVYNPYANTALGQSPFDWFRFDQEGNMMVGWFLDYDGSYYYLNPVSDGTRGKMMTGWVWIPDPAGVNKCYYLNPVSDGYRGRMYSNTVVEGYTVNGDGQWTVNGVIQTR